MDICTFVKKTAGNFPDLGIKYATGVEKYPHWCPITMVNVFFIERDILFCQTEGMDADQLALPVCYFASTVTERHEELVNILSARLTALKESLR